MQKYLSLIIVGLGIIASAVYVMGREAGGGCPI